MVLISKTFIEKLHIFNLGRCILSSFESHPTTTRQGLGAMRLRISLSIRLWGPRPNLSVSILIRPAGMGCNTDLDTFIGSSDQERHLSSAWIPDNTKFRFIHFKPGGKIIYSSDTIPDTKTASDSRPGTMFCLIHMLAWCKRNNILFCVLLKYSDRSPWPCGSKASTAYPLIQSQTSLMIKVLCFAITGVTQVRSIPALEISCSLEYNSLQ